MIKFRFMICYAIANAKYPILQLPLTPNLILSEEMQNSYRRHSHNKLDVGFVWMIAPTY